MELDQMVGVVRHLIAQNQGLVHMDEILTATLTAEQRMNDANKAVAAQEEVLKSKEEQVLALGEAAKVTAQELEDHLASVREADKAKYDQIVEEHEAKRMALEGSISALLSRESDLKSQVDALQGDVERYTKYKAGAVEEYERVKQALSSLTASIRL